MIDYEGFRKVGKFTLDTGVEVFGELFLKGRETCLKLYSTSPFEFKDQTDIHGVFYEEHETVSLFDCILLGAKLENDRSQENERRYISAVIFPHTVLFGGTFKGERKYIRRIDCEIDKIIFTVEDTHKIFYDTDTFGRISFDTRAKLELLLEGEEPKKKNELGSNPSIFYDTGKIEIISIDTAFGNVSANNYATPRSLFNKGIGVDNTIKIDIEFKSKVNIGEAIGTVYDLLIFLEILAGRPQNISQITCLSVEPDYKYFYFNVYLCHAQCHKIDNRFSVWPPIDAIQNPDEFSRVLRYWTEQHEERRHARVRFSEAFSHQNNYTIDRLIGAANMFDLLPASIYPKSVELSKELKEARCTARQAFRKLPKKNEERESVLRALGRIGQPVLKVKVRHRAKLITDIVGGHFPEIESVIKHAVNLRNYYVHGIHGEKQEEDYNKISSQRIFFTDTLEFIFAASELVEAGWDIAAWMKEKFPSGDHPFRTYYFRYRERLEVLKKLLAEKV